MARHRAFDDLHRQCRARPFAQPHVQRQKRRFSKFAKQGRMCGFGADMSGNTMVQCCGHRVGQTGGRRATDEPVQNHRDPFDTRPCDRPGHRSDFAPPKTAQGFYPVALPGVQGHARAHHIRLENKASIVNPRAAPDPVFGGAAEDRA